MLSFLTHFAASIFKGGGHVLHGSHPSFTPTLLEEAKRYIASGGRKDCLTLAVSKFWSKDTNLVPVQEWRATCMVYEIPEASGDSARDDSLEHLRQWMSDRCDAFVAVGGRWWHEVVGRSGVPLEAGLAIERGLPCFLLAGLGGAAHDYVRDHPSVIKSLKNGFDDATNKDLATREDVDSLVQIICDQLSRLPLVRGRVSDGISFRVLALDGGGVRGAFTAAVLATLEQLLGTSIAESFDLVAGTSTGGILAIGLGMGLLPRRMMEFYRDRGRIIFPMTQRHGRWKHEIRHLFRPKFSQDLLLRELKGAYYPDQKPKAFGDSICRLVIPAYDAVSGACHIFRTPHHPLLTGDADTDAAEVALATAAAPTYFSAAKVRNLIASPPYFDGGVWANSPALAAIVEAIFYLDVPLDRVDVLSVGTTESPFTVKAMGQAGWVGWGRSLVDLLMAAQVDSSTRHAMQLVGEPRFLRINSVAGPGLYTLDNAREIENLIAMGNKRASDPAILHQVKSRFLNGIAATGWKTTP